MRSITGVRARMYGEHVLRFERLSIAFTLIPHADVVVTDGDVSFVHVLN